MYQSILYLNLLKYKLKPISVIEKICNITPLSFRKYREDVLFLHKSLNSKIVCP